MVDAGHIASSGDHFLEYVDIISDRGFVFYRKPGGSVSGIVTASNLARAFDDTVSPGTKLQELENRIRILLDKSSLPALKSHLAPNHKVEGTLREPADMQFGEYLNALKDPDIWAAAHLFVRSAHLPEFSWRS